MSAPRTLSHQQLKALGRRLHTDVGMAELMNATLVRPVGPMTTMPASGVAPDPRHTGPGGGFFVVERSGNWRSVVLPVRVLQ